MEASHSLQCKLGLKADARSFLHYPDDSASLAPLYGYKALEFRSTVIGRLADHGEEYLEMNPGEIIAARISRGKVVRLLTGEVSPSQAEYEEPSFADKTSVSLYITLSASEAGTIPSIGNRYQDMLLCQPPVQQIVVEPSCWTGLLMGPDHDASDKQIILTSSSGVTMGHLWDAAQELQAEHKMCPDTQTCYHNEDGYVNVSVRATGYLLLNNNDPFLVKNELTDQYKAERLARTKKDQLLSAYIEAKRQARDDGQPIPTFAEFKDTYQSPPNDESE